MPSNSHPEPNGTGAPGPADSADAPGTGARRPAAISVVALIVAAEAAALLTAAGWYALQLLTSAPVMSFWGAVFTLVLLLSFSAWLFAVGHFLFRGYRWPRAGALVAQLFVLTIGVPTLAGGYVPAGLAMVIPAVIGVVLLFRKSVISFASRPGGPPPAL